MDRRCPPTRLLAASVAALLAACATARPAVPPKPVAFLWEVTRPGSSGKPLYLTGSIHAGKPGQLVLPPALEDAFARAGVLVVEIDSTTVQQEKLAPLLFELGMASSDGLSEETRTLLSGALGRLNLPPALAGHMRPWFITATLAVTELQQAGYSPEGGIDATLLKRAHADGKRIVELETSESQLRLLAQIPDDLMDLSLRELLVRKEPIDKAVGDIVAAWQAGDAEGVARLVLENANDPRYQALYQQLYFERNRKMADAIEPLVGGNEVHLVAVGAAHLVGPEGLVALMAKRGLQVRQLPRE